MKQNKKGQISLSESDMNTANKVIEEIGFNLSNFMKNPTFSGFFTDDFLEQKKKELKG